jgi:signal transduction histidine kinase
MHANKIKILIVDDEFGMRSGVERVLRDYKVPVAETKEEVMLTLQLAETGREALDKINLDKPDILLLDYKLPDINGLEILNIINEKQIDVLTIIVTAYASLEVAITATKGGAYDFLAKPFTPEELKSVIQKATAHLYHKWKVEQLEKERHQIRFEFISVLAHELKSPLQAVESYLRIMEQRIAGVDINKYNDMISRSLIRLEGMKKLIFDLLDLTRLESGKTQRELKDLELTTLAQECMELVSPLARERNIRLLLTAPTPIKFKADRTEMEMLLNNLLSNAVKYNKDNGEVQLSIQLEQQKIIISCHDTGIGMSAGEAARLFNEFVRIKNEKTEAITGSGLGLAILKKLVQLYQGEIKVESKPDYGSTFTVSLPVVL